MLKCSSERCVCAPQSLSAGTSTTPMLSVSLRKSVMGPLRFKCDGYQARKATAQSCAVRRLYVRKIRLESGRRSEVKWVTGRDRPVQVPPETPRNHHHPAISPSLRCDPCCE